MGNFDMLPSDVMLEIFSRLPTEDVIECKLVSKRWENLIKQPSFSQLHLNCLDSAHDSRSGKLSLIFNSFGYASADTPFYYSEYDDDLNCFTRRTRINLKLPFKSYRILGSCNGLLCFNAHLNGTYWQPAYICNPITREFILLPKFEGNESNDFLTGFGYVPSTNEYKVVRISKFPRRDPVNYGMVQVYTLGSGIGWRNVRKITDYNLISFDAEGVFFNGAVHWGNWDATIVALDLADEEFREIQSPPCLPPFAGELLVLGGFLCAYYKYKEGYDLWVLKKNTSTRDGIWSKEFSNINWMPITFTKSGGLLCYDFRDKKVYRYPQNPSSSRMLVNFGKHFIVGVCHKNTLVSLKALGEEDTKLMDSGDRTSFSGGTESRDH